jgi:hypothetical protein
MRFSTIFAMASAAGSAVAFPLWPRADCMTAADGAQVVENYKKLIAAYTEADGLKYTTKDFVDVSDSINTFIHQPLGGPTFATQTIFNEAQLQNPPFPLEVLSIDAVTCNVIALQWQATFGEAMLSSKGLTILRTAKDQGIWKISKIDVEFNALTWLLDMGGSYTWEDTTFTAEKPDPTLKKAS